MSELSTVAIKDGHRGHLPHHQHQQGPSGLSNQLDAERADRISRLAGLERVTTARNPQTPGSVGGHVTPGAGGYQGQPPPAVSYFDSTGNPALGRERSTVGSASATGSVGARTTWAGSEAGDNYDKMSESQDQDDNMMDMDNSSVGGMSEEGTPSLVAFGEGARTPARQGTLNAKGVREARYIDGMTYDQDVVDTTAVTPEARRNPTPRQAGGADQAERIMREHMDTTSNDRMRDGAGQGQLGKFGFEK